MADDPSDIFSGAEPPESEYEVHRLLVKRLEQWATALRGLVSDGIIEPANYQGLVQDLRQDFAQWEKWRHSLKLPEFKYKDGLKKIASLLKKPVAEDWIRAAQILDELAVGLNVFKPAKAKQKRKYSDREVHGGKCPECGLKGHVTSRRGRKRTRKCESCGHTWPGLPGGETTKK